MLSFDRPAPRVNDILSMSAARLDALADQVADGLANSGLGDSIGRRESWSPPPPPLHHSLAYCSSLSHRSYIRPSLPQTLSSMQVQPPPSRRLTLQRQPQLQQHIQRHCCRRRLARVPGSCRHSHLLPPQPLSVHTRAQPVRRRLCVWSRLSCGGRCQLWLPACSQVRSPAPPPTPPPPSHMARTPAYGFVIGVLLQRGEGLAGDQPWNGIYRRRHSSCLAPFKGFGVRSGHTR